MAEGRRRNSHGDINAWDTGDRDAATVLVYLPGLGERGAVFADVVRAEALTGFRHVVIDYVDWTKSTPPAESISLEAVAERIAGWTAEHLPRPVVLVGHSMGGVLGQLVAELHPELVAKLIDIEGNVSRDDCTFSGKATACSLDELVAGGFTECKRQLRGDADPNTRRYADGLGVCAPTTYYAYAKPLVGISREETLARRLATLTMPVLYVHGEDPRRGISERSREMLRENRIRVAPIAHAGHWPYVDQPEQFIRVVRDFIRA